MIEPRAAPVRPRVLLPDATGAVLLEDEVAERLEAGECSYIELAGPPGSGKSTALAHLARLFGSNSQLRLADTSNMAELLPLFKASTHQLVICTAAAATGRSNSERWRLTPWTSDECIEYLLNVHRDRCASVMQRIQAEPERRSLGGVAELWSVVLDRLAVDPSLTDVKTALRSYLQMRISTAEKWAFAGECCLASLTEVDAAPTPMELLVDGADVEKSTFSLLRHSQVQTLLGAERLFVHLKMNLLMLQKRLSESIICETATLIRNHLPTISGLQKTLEGPAHARHAMAASLLHAAGVNWIPARGKAPLLAGAYLSGVQWPKIRLEQFDASKADLTGADLSESQLDGVCLHNTQMSGVMLHGAWLKKLSAMGARLANADLSFTRTSEANFYTADLRNANFEGALLRSGKFRYADLRGGRFCRADLIYADLTGCQIEEADFSQATLCAADLSGLELRLAEFAGAKFTRAILVKCDLEYMRLPGAIFEDALLQGAHLTGSQMPNACFRGANLAHTGLAEIDWPRADLRDADLRGATFHLGSTRSGLVGSPIACEGSRTGFYTDELTEQDFKSPEEIRKANLCGADLRGAKIDNVDFYLVDLRNAHYTNDQEMQFRRCGAILETRV